ncbi:poly ADP-ribose polymerase, putative, partial [Entamoeba invadens IP1]|uniref:poly ADP-ribose polymerase, putative n=1 Tax=Entamoeba invadens IP1 TaxID=370355 RepID=UPI0002C3E887
MTLNMSYRFEYSKTSRGSCKSCGQTIEQGELKYGKEVKSRFHDGVEVQWNHGECIKNTSAFKNTKLTTTKGWDKLRWDDFLALKEEMQDDFPMTDDQEKEFKEINERFWEARDKLSGVTPKIIRQLMEENGQKFDKKVDNDTVLDACADALEFGLLDECPQCHCKMLSNHLVRIVCHGNMTEFVKCDYTTPDLKSIKRFKATIGEKLAKIDKKKILSEWEFPEDYPKDDAPATTGAATEAKAENDTTPEDDVPVHKELIGMSIFVQGTKKELGDTISAWQEMVKSYGGTVVKNAAEASVCLSTSADMNSSKMTTGMKDAKETLTCLTLEWVDELTERNEGFMKLRTKEGAEKYLCENCEWKTEIVKEKYHAPKGIVKETFKPTADSEILKVHSLNSMEGYHYVYYEDDPVYGWTVYNVVLSKTDMDTGANSVYNMQIAGNGTKRYHMIWQWGRIGSSLKETTRQGTIDEMKKEWETKFEECTGNRWADRTNFQKKGGRYFMQALDTGKDDADAKKTMSAEAKKKIEEKKIEIQKRASEFKLDARVARLIKMIFDKGMMTATLKSAGLNVANMPLGKIKIEQMKEAMKVLSKLSDVISKDSELDEKMKEVMKKDLTAKYYTYVPHVLTAGEMRLIDTDEKIKTELKLVETMCDVGEAMKLMEEDEGMNFDEQAETFSHYQQLKTKITALDKTSDRYHLLEEFFINNQETNSYRKPTSIVDIFEIDRENEKQRFEPFSTDANRQLLYHGSRLTNFVGILSTG